MVDSKVSAGRGYGLAVILLNVVRGAVRKPGFWLDVFRDVFGVWRKEGVHGVAGVVDLYLTTGNKSLVRDHLRTYRRNFATPAKPAGAAVTLLTDWQAEAATPGKHPRIAIGLVEHMGDIVANEPVVRHLRAEYPDAEISWVVNAGYRDLIDAHPGIDRTIAVDCLTDWIKIAGHGGFDRYVDLHVNGKFCLRCLVPLAKRKGALSITTETYLNHGSLLSAFSLGAGLPALNDAPRVYISSEIVAKVDAMDLPGRFIVLHCRTNEPARDWSDRNWFILASWLKSTYGVEIIEIGLQPVAAGRGKDVIDYCSKTSLLETAEIIRRAMLFVGLNSGPAHLANAVQTPGVVLIGQYRGLERYNPFSGGYADGSNATIVYHGSDDAKALPLNAVQAAIEHRWRRLAATEAVGQVEHVTGGRV